MAPSALAASEDRTRLEDAVAGEATSCVMKNQKREMGIER
jgi:hypothetical protein